MPGLKYRGPGYYLSLLLMALIVSLVAAASLYLSLEPLRDEGILRIIT